MLVNNSFLGESLGLTSEEKRKNAQIEANFAEYLRVDDTPEAMMEKITKNGVQSLLEHKIDMLKKKLTEQAMAAKGITSDELAAMPPEERLQVMQSILEQVQEQLKMAMNEQMKKEKKLELGYLDAAPMQTDTFAQILIAQETRSA